MILPLINLFHGIYHSRYHGPVAPKGSDLASLQLIMAEGDEIRLFTAISSPPSSSSISNNLPLSTGSGVLSSHPSSSSPDLELSNSEKEILGNYINPTYLEKEAMKKINKQFCEDSSVQLKNFLRTDIANEIMEATVRVDKEELLGKMN